jgi:hypothetical protein
MFDANALFALLMMHEMSEPLWANVEAVQRSARRAVEVAHWSDNPEGVAMMRKLTAMSAEMMAQGMAAERALALIDKNGRAARKVLWQAYPGHRKDVYLSPTFHVSADGLASLEPAGRAFYAFAVARVIRATCIDWYNAQHPSSYEEAMNLQSTARWMGSSAHRWATHAMSCLGRETLSPATVAEIHEALQGLMAAFQRDAAVLT